MLMDNAITDLLSPRLTRNKRAFLDDARLYGSSLDYVLATTFLETENDPDLWNFYVLRRLTMQNLTSKPSIRATIDLRRMSILADALYDNTDGWNQNFETLVQGCMDLAADYEKKVKFSTLFYSMAAGVIDRQIGSLQDVDLDKQVSLRRQ